MTYFWAFIRASCWSRAGIAICLLMAVFVNGATTGAKEQHTVNNEIFPDHRHGGLKLNPPDASILGSGKKIQITVDVLSMIAPTGGVWLFLPNQQPMLDASEPYSFEVVLPKQAGGQLFSIDASAQIGQRKLTDHATYRIEGGALKWVLLGVLFCLIAATGAAFLTKQNRLLAAAVVVILMLLGYIQVRTKVSEKYKVDGGNVSYVRRENILGTDGKWTQRITQQGIENVSGEESSLSKPVGSLNSKADALKLKQMRAKVRRVLSNGNPETSEIVTPN